MNIDKEALRARRLQLGIPKRELAKAAGVSLTVITRLEETGDASPLQVQTLMAILRSLSVDLVDVTHHSPKEDLEEGTFNISELGQLLHGYGRAMPISHIAECLGISLEEVDSAIQELDSNLRAVGLRLNHASTGIHIVPSAGSPKVRQATEAARRTRSFEVLNHGDLSLLYRAMKDRLPANVVAGRNNGNVSLHKLENADLIRVESGGSLVLTDRALVSLGCEQSE